MSNSHDKEKKYYEYLAKKILETYIPEKYENLTLSDRPDLRMGDNFGIEVTRAVYPNMTQASGTFQHIARKSISQVDGRHLSLLEKLGCRVFTNEKGFVFGYVPYEAIWINDEVLKVAYQKKVNKYETTPLTTIKNDLFIYSPMDNWLEEDLVKGFMEWVYKTQKSPFECIIVFEYSYLYSYNVKRNEFSAFALKELSAQELEKCYELAKDYALSENG